MGKRTTKLDLAMMALREVRKEIGDERFKTDASGSLQMRMGRYVKGDLGAYGISEATINAARRRLLETECQECGRRPSP